jgi:hypothetical protein
VSQLIAAMKKIYYLFLLLMVMCLSVTESHGQQLVYEPFDYPADATNGLHVQSNGLWFRINSGDSILVEANSLTYPGLASSTGNKVKFDGSGSDNYRTFTTQTSGSVYASFILNVSALGGLTTTGGYFFGFIEGGSTNVFCATVWTRLSATAGKYNIGIATRTTASNINWLPNELDPGTSYFITTAFDIVSGTGNDVARIWLNTTAIGATEPTANATAVPGADPLSIGRVLIRQDNATNTPFIEVDEIRVGTTWESVTPSGSSAPATPTTTSISPSSATAGGNAFTLTVNGTNFISGQSTVTWNGSNRTTTFVSATQLTADISAADIATAGSASVGVTTTGAAAVSNTQTFTINAAATPVLSATALNGFGATCLNTTAGPNSFTLSGSSLTTADISLAALSGFSYSTTSNGTYTPTLTLSQPGGTFNQEVFVRFTPTAVQTYDGNIAISGGGATAINIAVTGSGVNTLPTVTASSAQSVTTSGATIPGTITVAGCGAITAYGVEYSTTSGFANGSGTAVAGSNLTSGIFSVDLSGLNPSSTYYFKTFATNTAGSGYSNQLSFTTQALTAPAAPVALAATAITTTGFTANWNAVTGATGYFLDVYTLGAGTITTDIAGWNFDVNTASSQTADVGNINNAGIQTITGVGLNTISWPGGPTSTTGTNPYSVSANGWDNGADTKFWQININTIGAADLTLSSYQGSSGTGPRDFKVQYRVGATGTWTDVPGSNLTIPTTVSPGNPATWANLSNLPLPAAVNNEPLVSIRWLVTSTTSVTGSTVAATGTSRISAIYVKGNVFSSTAPIYVAGYQNLSVGNVTSYAVTGLNPSTNYYYVVRAVGAGGTSGNSNEISLTTSTPAAPSISITGTVNDFGSVTVGSFSTSQTFSISGTNLTGAPGNITITAPSSDFQVSSDNSTWASSATIPYNGATLASTPVYVRFSPQSSGSLSGNLTISGGGISPAQTIAVSGTGTAQTPPAAPIATAATAISSSGFTANWNAVTGATGYRLDVYTITSGSGVSDIAGWNFATNTSANQTADVGNANNIGIQTISGNGLGTISWPGGPTSTTGTNPYSVSANGWDNGADTKYWTVNVNTTGATNITVSSMQGGSNTGPKEFKLQYRIGTGGTWTDISGANVTLTTAVSPGNPATWGSLSNVALPSAADNQPLVSLRWISTGNVAINGSTVASGGTSRISAIYIKGTTSTGGTTINYVPGYQNLALGNVTSHAVTGLAGSTTYYYVVRAENAGGTSPNSNEISVTTAASINPVLTASVLSGFGNVCPNTTAGPNSFTLTGSNLTTADVTVGPLAGFSFSTTSGGTYSATLNIPQTGGSFSQQVFVKFTPVATQSYNGNIPVSGGGTSTNISVAVSGAGVNSAPLVTTGSASSVTNTSATLAGSITSNGCSSITAYGFEYSTTSGFANGSGTTVASSNLTSGSFSASVTGLTANTTYYYKAYATNGGGTAYGTEQSFTTAAAPPTTLTATALTAFGATCVGTPLGPNTFTITGENLTIANVNVGPLNGYSFATTANGTYAPSLSLTQPGGSYSQVIYVKFTPVITQAYNGNISISGGGASSINVAASGTGVHTVPAVTTGNASSITSTSAVLSGSITDPGCSNTVDYGIEYSGISGFGNGTGTTISAGTISTGNFSVQATGLVQGATYYYKAYARNNGGTAYGAQRSFTVTAIPNAFTIYPVPVVRGQTLRFSMNHLNPGYYGLIMYNSMGQEVVRKNFHIQAGFINDQISIPFSLTPGIYRIRIMNEFRFLETRTLLVE